MTATQKRGLAVVSYKGNVSTFYAFLFMLFNVPGT